ncbi:unnamed protein product [Gadus morhua 'NCC']
MWQSHLPTSKCGKGQRRKIPNSKNVPSEDGNDEHVAEPKTKSKRKQATTAQSASKSILQKYKNAQIMQLRPHLAQLRLLVAKAEARKVFPEAAEADIRRFMREKLSNAAKTLRRKEKSDRT